MAGDAHQQRLFWGCFLALITTAFGFITRMFLLGEWSAEFGLDEAETGELAGMGIWPFAISIIAFSLFIDRIGYKTAMYVSFVGYLVWSVMGVSAFFVSGGGEGNPELGYQLLYWGSLILGLSNGTVEAYINPIVATIFSREKTKWLNILHAGWPGGLVTAGLITIGLNAFETDWWIRIAIIVLPAIVFFIMLAPLTFPQQERVAAGVSYREMLAEFGVLGSGIAVFLIVLQLIQTFPDNDAAFITGGVLAVGAFGAYTRSLGNPILVVLALIMLPLATTELGTDSWIEEIMKSVAAGKFDPGLVLVYTSAIMMVLRFFAGPIVHTLSPIGLLMASALLAILGLYTLSFTQGLMIFAAATLYGVGKSFFWPTMLGIAAEQTPKGGALTLNALGGIGMLAVGTLGNPYIGALQSEQAVEAVAESDQINDAMPGVLVDGQLTVADDRQIYSIIDYRAINEQQLAAAIADAPVSDKEQLAATVADVRDRSKQLALADVCVFPAIMFAAYLGLGLYFRARGGYKAEVLIGHAAQDEQFTGGVEGPAER